MKVSVPFRGLLILYNEKGLLRWIRDVSVPSRGLLILYRI